MRIQTATEVEIADATVLDDQEMKPQTATELGFTLSVHDDGAP